MASSSSTSKYDSFMPSIRKDPLQMYKPKRKGENKMTSNEKDVIKSLHVGDYYEFVARTWNHSHSNETNYLFELFDDGLDSRDRTKMHKKYIGELLSEHISDLYARFTLGQARKANYTKMKLAMDVVFEDEMFRIYKKHSFNGWLIEKLVEQKMESASRPARSKKSKTPQTLNSSSKAKKDTEVATPINDESRSEIPFNGEVDLISTSREDSQFFIPSKNAISNREREEEIIAPIDSEDEHYVLHSDMEVDCSQSQVATDIQPNFESVKRRPVVQKSKDAQLRHLEEQIAVLRQKKAFLSSEENTHLLKMNRGKRVPSRDGTDNTGNKSKRLRGNQRKNIVIVSRPSRTTPHSKN